MLMRRPAMHCERCRTDVDAQYEHPRLRRLARYYLFIPIPFVPLFPIIGSDYVVMLPLMMAYMLGIGPVLTLVREKPICPVCGAHVATSTPA